MRRLPAIVFQHFRNPQNLAAMPSAHAVGQIEGRKEESWARLYLRNDPVDRVQTSFQLQGDRSCVAGLSLTTSLINGWPLERVEQVTLESVAAAYGLAGELLPVLTPGVDALQAALANLRGEPSPFAADGELVCTCLHVRQGRIERAIRERKLKTVEEVRFWTAACSGCRSCRDDVEALIKRCGDGQP